LQVLSWDEVDIARLVNDGPVGRSGLRLVHPVSETPPVHEPKRGPMAAKRLGLAVVRGRSMEPTLQEGDRLVVIYGARPRVGRLAVVQLPGRPVAVKRVTAAVDDGWWVERDNPAEGVDSWLVGALSARDVVAVVVGRLWPRPSVTLSR
jgi:hypothetical protein